MPADSDDVGRTLQGLLVDPLPGTGIIAAVEPVTSSPPLTRAMLQEAIDRLTAMTTVDPARLFPDEPPAELPRFVLVGNLPRAVMLELVDGRYRWMREAPDTDRHPAICDRAQPGDLMSQVHLMSPHPYPNGSGGDHAAAT